MVRNDAKVSVSVIAGSISRLAGGLFQSVRSSAQEIAKLGHPVHVYGLRDVYSDADHAAWAPLLPTVLDTLGPSKLGIPRDLRTRLDAANPDVLHQHGIWMGFSHSVARWGQRHDRPVVISPRGMLDPWALNQARTKKRIAALLYESRNLEGALVLHALNRAEARAIRAFGLKAPIAIIPNGTELPDLPQTPPPPDFLPQDGRRTLVFLGRLHPKKCVAELITAWTELARDNAVRNWRLVVAGWGDSSYTNELAALADKAGLGDSLILPGPVHYMQKTALFAHAHAFVLPSLSEGLPMAVLEAWSYGLPALMSDACNLPEGFDNGAALRVSPDPVSLAQDLRTALARADLAQIGARGRELVETCFTWKKIAHDFSAVYEWCHGGGSLPDCIELSDPHAPIEERHLCPTRLG